MSHLSIVIAALQLSEPSSVRRFRMATRVGPSLPVHPQADVAAAFHTRNLLPVGYRPVDVFGEGRFVQSFFRVVLLVALATFAILVRWDFLWGAERPIEEVAPATRAVADRLATGIRTPTASASPAAAVWSVIRAKCQPDPKCPPWADTNSDKGCFVTVVPGKGLAGIVVGKSTRDDVLRIFGRDARLKHEYLVNYAYADNETYAADRFLQRFRPSDFEFKNNILEKIIIGPRQRCIVTAGGTSVYSTKDEMIKEFGGDYKVKPDESIDSYHYTARGIEFWLHNDSQGSRAGNIISLFIRQPR